MNSIYTMIYTIFCHCCTVSVTCLRPALDPECPRLELIKSHPTKAQHFQFLDNTLFLQQKCRNNSSLSETTFCSEPQEVFILAFDS